MPSGRPCHVGLAGARATPGRTGDYRARPAGGATTLFLHLPYSRLTRDPTAHPTPR